MQRVAVLDGSYCPHEDEPQPKDGGRCPRILEAVVDPSKEPLSLLNLLPVLYKDDVQRELAVQKGGAWSTILALAQLLTRVEDLSHCLVWQDGPPDSCFVHLVELPRLGLAFRAHTSSCQVHFTETHARIVLLVLMMRDTIRIV